MCVFESLCRGSASLRQPCCYEGQGACVARYTHILVNMRIYIYIYNTNAYAY